MFPPKPNICVVLTKFGVQFHQDKDQQRLRSISSKLKETQYLVIQTITKSEKCKLKIDIFIFQEKYIVSSYSLKPSEAT